ncbi:hypothetical protein EMIT0158MI4_40002 [Burkholderia ambifaria]
MVYPVLGDSVAVDTHRVAMRCLSARPLTQKIKYSSRMDKKYLLSKEMPMSGDDPCKNTEMD